MHTKNNLPHIYRNIEADPALPHTDFAEKEIKHMWTFLALFILLIVHGWIGQVV